jgi:hypothetical protein
MAPVCCVTIGLIRVLMPERCANQSSGSTDGVNSNFGGTSGDVLLVAHRLADAGGPFGYHQEAGDDLFAAITTHGQSQGRDG